MNFVAQVEEHLRDLGSEARKKHPGVKEASERAILVLRQLQNQYVTAVRKATQNVAESSQHPTTTLFRSQDILRPFLLACNYPNASSKLLWISLDAFSLLIKGNAINPEDGIHLIRVWTIQANVCASNLCAGKQQQQQQQSGGKSSKSSSSNDGGGEHRGDGAPASSSSSSWFGWSSSASTTSSAAIATTSTSTALAHHHDNTGGVSSSSGTTGSHGPKKESERIALELLSLLIQFLETVSSDTTSNELLAASVHLCCILLQINNSNKHTSSATTAVVYQAAKSTLHQVLTLLVETKTTNNDFTWATWSDLLVLSSSKDEQQQQQQLTGAFQQVEYASQHQGPPPPSPVVCLELLHSILTTTTTSSSKDEEGHSWKENPELLNKTVSLVQKNLSNDSAELEISWRSNQLACALLLLMSSTRSQQKNEQLLVVQALIENIVRATEACRNNHDFEDGYVYYAGSDKPKKHHPTTLIPESLLWKAGLALESFHTVLESANNDLSVLEDSSVVILVAEAVSDFCTIGASCRDHMLQLLECCGKGDDRGTHRLFHMAEQQVIMNSSRSNVVMGEALWTAVQVILRLAGTSPSVFAPTLAMLQHYLKRFPGSSMLVKVTLQGYTTLADLSIPSEELQRKALLASLCKLSLPSWGKLDNSGQLEDHHVESLVCLFKIIHKHYNEIDSEWHVVLKTFEELSGLSIASPKLSEDGYMTALAVSATFSRIAPLSTCLSDATLTFLVDALADTAISCLEQRGVVSDSDRALEPSPAPGDSGHRRKPSVSDSIGGKLMNLAGRTLLGTQSADTADGEDVDVAVVSRTKNTYFGDYRKDFLNRMTTSKRAVRGDVISKLPFSVIALTDVALANLYRYQYCGRRISAHLCALSATSMDIRDYAMDTLAMLVTSQLLDEPAVPPLSSGPGRIVTETPNKNEYFVVEELPMKKFAGEESGNAPISLSQADLIGPLCDTIHSAESADAAETVISALRSILEGVGHHLTGNVWTVIVESVASLSGDASFSRDGVPDRSGSEWAPCSVIAFRCVKLIVDDFIDQLPPSSDAPSPARTALLDCCFYFGASRHDVNTSLTAIGLLWSIADQDSNSWSIDRALSRLVLLSVDDRVEVRNCAINTLFSCVVGRGQGFDDSQWESCICDTIFSVYDRVLLKGGGSEAEESASRNGDSSSNRASSRYKVSIHHSRDSAGKQWATTEVMVLRGLTRVLRNFFDLIFAGSQVPGQEEPIWFEDAWSRTLEYASEAAGQAGSRETLDLRISGVELLVLCTQLSCRSGIHAAITPARVGTHMEVVNGALRSVRDSNSKTQERQNGAEAKTEESESFREHLFLTAFDALDMLQHQLDDEDTEDQTSRFVDTVQVQVLHRLALGLSKLYDCCKDDELSPQRAARLQRRPSRIQTYLGLDQEATFDSDDLEGRFIHLVATIVQKAVSDPSARFLTQAQRTAFDLLRSMVSQSSDEALRVLASLGGHSFFWDVRRDGDDSEQGGSNPSTELLSREAAKVVSDEIANDSLSDNVKVQVLCRILSEYTSETERDGWKVEASRGREHHRKRCYKLLVPVMESGLQSAERLETTISNNADDQETLRILDLLWEKVFSALSQMLSPLQGSGHKPYIPRVSSLLELLSSTFPLVPKRLAVECSDILSSGAYNALDVSKVNGNAIEETKDSETVRRLKKRHEEAQKLFGICLSGLCKIAPVGRALELLVASALGDAISSTDASLHGDLPVRDDDGSVKIAVLVCEAIQASDDMEPLVIAVFPLLCKLISVDHKELRREVGKIMSHVDIGGALEDATTRLREAEERVAELEQQNEELLDIVDELREDNQKLQQQMAVYGANTL